MKKILILLLVLGLICFNSNVLFAKKDVTKVTIGSSQYEVWKSKGMVFAVRSPEGKFITWGKGKLEKWKGREDKVWVIRNPGGAFITWGEGKREKWEDGLERLVVRDKKGRYVCWTIIDKGWNASFEIWEGLGIKYVVRDDRGRFRCWGTGKMEVWDKEKNRSVYVVRDKEGRFLTWTPGKNVVWSDGKTRIVMRDKKGHFLGWKIVTEEVVGDFEL